MNHGVTHAGHTFSKLRVPPPPPLTTTTTTHHQRRRLAIATAITTASRSMKKSNYIATLVSLAFMAVLGICLVIFSCFLTQTSPGSSKVTQYYTLLMIPSTISAAIPLAIATSAKKSIDQWNGSRGTPASHQALLETCYFIAGMLMTSVIGIPFMLFHIGRIGGWAAIDAAIGSCLFLVALICYRAVFHVPEEDRAAAN